MGAGRRLSAAEPDHDGGSAPLLLGCRRANRPVEPPSVATTGPESMRLPPRGASVLPARVAGRLATVGRPPPSIGGRRRAGHAECAADRRAPADRLPANSSVLAYRYNERYFGIVRLDGFRESYQLAGIGFSAIGHELFSVVDLILPPSTTRSYSRSYAPRILICLKWMSLIERRERRTHRR